MSFLQVSEESSVASSVNDRLSKELDIAHKYAFSFA